MPYGSALYPGATTYPDSTTYPGQGPEFSVQPELQFLVSFSDYRAGSGGAGGLPPPAWQDVTSLAIGSWRTSRGRDNELSEISGATATASFDNRDRFFIPGISAGLYPDSSTYPSSATYPGAGSAGPMNRLWIKEFFNGKVRTLFYGYAESFDFGWEALAERATINASDEFQVLSRAQLPKNSPDVGSGGGARLVSPETVGYEPVVSFDRPTGYWRFNEGSNLSEFQGTAGPSLFWFGTVPTASSESPVLGDVGPSTGTASVIEPASGALYAPVDEHGVGDAEGISSFSIELWFRIENGPPTSIDYLVYGPDMTGAIPQYTLGLTSGNQFEFHVDDGATYKELKTGSVLTPSGYSNWYHVVAVKDGSTLRLYQNGVAQSTAAYSGAVRAANADSIFRVNGTGGNSKTINYDEVAWYPYALDADRVLAHYNAARNGYPIQSSKARLNAILDDIVSVMPRSFHAGKQNVAPVFKYGQDALGEIRNTLVGEGGDAMFFAGHDPTSPSQIKTVWVLNFLDADHREGPPWDQVQATFLEAPSGSPDQPAAGYLYYDSLEIDYSGTFLVNDWTVTDAYGESARAYDQGSIDRYGWRARSLSGPIISSGSTYAADLLAKYRYPLPRVTSISLDTSAAATTDVLFDLELGDLVRILHTPSGIDQRSYVQRIELEGANDMRPIRVTLGVSPL